MKKKAVTRPLASGQSIFSSFACPPDSYCETFLEPSVSRSHWQSIIEVLDGIDPIQLARRQERVDRMRHEDGITYNPFDDPGNRTSTWALDMIPLPLTTEEWQFLETGVRQRAMLLEQVLADVYGEQTLVKNGRLPAELIFANPNFLRACHGVVPAGNRFLTYYAVDICRGPDGSFRVLRDYGGQPAGLGYALENRIVISRVFPELYRQTQIQRLAPFFKLFHRSLLERVALHRDDPGIVLLSPGPDSRYYFEHALLSRYLGYPLVEGEDLTVRNGRVYLKKLAGLEPVEAIFRFISDTASDPFALRQTTTKGVAGLIQAVREKTIDIVNPIGAGFIDTPLLSIYLEELCQLLRGETLLLASQPSWWCGDPASREYVLANLANLRLQHAMDGQPAVENLETAKVVESIQQASHSWLARAPIQASGVPVWENGRVEPHYCLMRLFACATEEGFQVMPGGLAVTAPNISSLSGHWPLQQRTKDIWVMSEQPVEPFSMMSSLQSVAEFRRTSDLPSRVADNLLWLGRYLERAEGQVRLLRSVFRRLSGEASPEDIPELDFLLGLLRAAAVFPVDKDDKKKWQYDELMSLMTGALFDRARPESVVSTLTRVQEVAKNVRDRLSLDCWRVINHLDSFAYSSGRDPLDVLEDTLFTLSSFSGLAMESMTRGLGWRFMDMGRRAERAMNQVGLIRAGLEKICDTPTTALEALLEVADSIMTYRGRYRTSFQLAPVLDLLLMDESNPKSLAFQLSQLAEHVEQLPRQDVRRFSTPEERLALEMLTGVRLLDLDGVQCSESCDTTLPLLEFLDSVEKMLLEFTQQITAQYLSRVPSTPHYSISLSDRDE